MHSPHFSLIVTLLLIPYYFCIDDESCQKESVSLKKRYSKSWQQYYSSFEEAQKSFLHEATEEKLHPQYIREIDTSLNQFKIIT